MPFISRDIAGIGLCLGKIAASAERERNFSLPFEDRREYTTAIYSFLFDALEFLSLSLSYRSPDLNFSSLLVLSPGSLFRRIDFNVLSFYFAILDGNKREMPVVVSLERFVFH